MSIRRWGSYSTNPGVNYIPEILKSLELLTKPAGGAAIAAGTGNISPGTFMYQIVSAGASQYYWVPSKVAKVDTSLGAATTTSFYTRNPAFKAGDVVTVGAAAGAVVASVDPNTGLVTLTGAITLPTNGMRVFSATAAENAIKAIALDYAPTLTNSDQAIEVAISGVFKKDVMDSMYEVTDLTAWGALAIPEVNAYRWS